MNENILDEIEIVVGEFDETTSSRVNDLVNKYLF